MTTLADGKCSACGNRRKILRYVNDTLYEPKYDHPPRLQEVDCPLCTTPVAFTQPKPKVELPN